MSTQEPLELDNPLIQQVIPPILAGPPPKMMLAPLSPATGSAHSPIYRSQSIPHAPNYSHPPEAYGQDWQQQRDAEDTRRAGLLQHANAGGSAFKYSYGQEQSHQPYQHPLPNALPHDSSSAGAYPTPNPYAPGPSRVTASNSSTSPHLQDVPQYQQPPSLPPYISTYQSPNMRSHHSSDGSQPNTPSSFSNSSAYTVASSIEGDWDRYGPLSSTIHHPTAIQSPQTNFPYAPVPQYNPSPTFHPADPRGANPVPNRSIAIPTTHYSAPPQQNEAHYYPHYAIPSESYARRADLRLPNSSNESGVQYGGGSGPIYDNPGWAPQYGSGGPESNQSGRGKKRRMEY